MTPRRLLVIHNPVAGRRHRRRYRATIAILRSHGCTVVERDTQGPGDAERFARDERDNFDVIVAAGGDGTINEVANGIAGCGVLLGIIPLGTANVLAAEVGLPLGAREVAGVLAHSAPRTIYAGLINGRRFLMMAGIGFDARAVTRVVPALKRLLGKGAYAVAALSEWWVNDLPRYRVALDGTTTEVASIVIAKGRSYGGKFWLAPRADLAAPHFEACWLPRASRGALLTVAGSLALCAGLHRNTVCFARASTVRITGPVGEPVQADGDIVAHLPVDITIAAEPLQLLVP